MDFLLWIAICGGIGAMIGNRTGQAIGGFIFGLLLGPLGWIITALSSGNRVKCPFCRELIDPKASICPKCQSALAGGRGVQIKVVPAARAISYPEIPVESSAATPPPPRRTPKRTLRVAQDGVDLGELEIPVVKKMLADGNLSTLDYFLDSETNSWMTLDCCRELAA